MFKEINFVKLIHNQITFLCWAAFRKSILLNWFIITSLFFAEQHLLHKKFRDASQCRHQFVELYMGRQLDFITYQCNMSLLPFLSFISSKCSKITRNSRLSYHEGDMNFALLPTSSPSKVWVFALGLCGFYSCLSAMFISIFFFFFVVV